MPSFIALAMNAMMNEGSAAPHACSSTRECPRSAGHEAAEAAVKTSSRPFWMMAVLQMPPIEASLPTANSKLTGPPSMPAWP
eukprot:7094221-Pyramimonas_sp.AAC.1